MKSFVLVLSLVVGSWVLSPTPVAQASWFSNSSWFSNWWNSGGSSKVEKFKKHKKHKKHKKGNKGGNAVPELDPTAAGSAIVLMLGGVAYIASRRREEDLV